jgi:hypothetical protein
MLNETPAANNVAGMNYRPIALLSVCMLFTGCASHWPTQDRSLKGSEAQFNVPPKQMLETVKKVVTDPPLSLGVQEEANGSVLTGYQSFPGEWHIGRRWQERTQYRVQIIPDFDQPTGKCSVQVRENTETRAAEGMKWAPATDVTRPERAAEVLKQIQQQAGGSTGGGATTR